MELFNGEKTIFMDGGMGTMLQARGLQAGEAPDLWNLSHPEEVQAVHRAYLEAGSQWISTNTFGTNAKKIGANRKKRFRDCTGRSRLCQACGAGL